jgi:hypothetical protein
MLQSADIVFKSVGVSRVFGISERQGYASKAAPLCFKSHGDPRENYQRPVPGSDRPWRS